MQLLAHAPGSVPARAVLRSYEDSDDCESAVDDVVEAYLANGDPARLPALRELVRVVHTCRVDMENAAVFVLEAWALLRDDEANATRLEDAAARLGEKYRNIAKVLHGARKDPVETCARLQADPEELAARCAAILVATGALDGVETPAARLVRARAELDFRGRTDPGPLVDPPPETAEHAALAALALLSNGDREGARTFAARQRGRFEGDLWAPTLAQIEEQLSVPPSDVSTLVEKTFEPALRDLFAGAPRWEIVLKLWGEERDAELTFFLDFAQKECRAVAKSKGSPVAILHARGDAVRLWLAGDRIHEMPLVLPAVLLEFAAGEDGKVKINIDTVDAPWTDTGRVNAPLLVNPLFTTREGIRRLVTRPSRLVMLRQGAEATCTWTWPRIREPGFGILEARFEQGRLASLRSDDSSLVLRYGDEAAVPRLMLEWPDLAVEKHAEADAGALFAIMGRLAARLGLGEPEGR
ncbi:MAG: hypothetical protein L6Q95_05600 [Planctomycetes bacterium]|nr:hypothetical protein [Planctomycetota bacterium]